MIPVSIDIDDFVAKSFLSEQEIKGFTSMLLDRLALKFQEDWIGVIGENLHSTRQEYMRGIFVDRPDDNSIVFGVTARKSRLAVDLELGKNPFDEKEGLSKSSKKTMKKGGQGWYIRIPFRWAIPSSIGESGVFSGIMPMAIYKIAKSQSTPIQFRQLPSQFQRRGVRQTLMIGNKMIPAYQHKSPIFEGLVRYVDVRENRGQYMTFRTVSDVSDPNAFWHPGFKSYNLLGKTLEKVDLRGVVLKTKIDFLNNRS